MKTLYTATVKTIGGRKGKVHSNDGVLDLSLSAPVSMGGDGSSTNPEQLFAAGYAACFCSAVHHIAESKGVKFNEDDVEVEAIVDLNAVEDGFDLDVILNVSLHGIEENLGNEVVQAAHQLCPYSRALRNSVDVKLAVHFV